jgi:sortase (surface protein transpeptidase)
VVSLDTNSDGTLQVPSRSDEAGWYDGSVPPGDEGASVIVGHLDSFTGPAVFYRLGDLTPGSEVEVRLRGGPWAMFRVTRVAEFSKSTFPTEAVYGRTAAPTLRLITCGGAFDASTGHYLDNVVVFAVSIEGRTAAS